MDPFTAGAIVGFFSAILSGADDCSKCNYREADGTTSCCDTPMCETCMSGRIKQINYRKARFDCPFCGRKTTVEV